MKATFVIMDSPPELLSNIFRTIQHAWDASMPKKQRAPGHPILILDQLGWLWDETRMRALIADAGRAAGVDPAPFIVSWEPPHGFPPFAGWPWFQRPIVP